MARTLQCVLTYARTSSVARSGVGAVCASLLATAALSSQPTRDARWLAVHIAPDGTSYIDTTSIIYSEDTAIVWVRSEYTKPRLDVISKAPYARELSKVAIACKGRLYSNLSVVEYEGGGSVVSSTDFQRVNQPRPWSDIPPETLAEHVRVFACPAEAHYWRAVRPNGTPSQTSPTPVPDRLATASVITGSAFFVNEAAVALTNAHVVEGCNDVSVGTARDSGHVIARDVGRDLAAIQVRTRVKTIAATLSDKNASLGETVVAAGYPLSGLLSSQLNVTVGNVLSLAGPREDASVFQITSPIQPGNSGGPVLGSEGAVVGVVRATLNPRAVSNDPTRLPQNVNFAIKVSLVRTFLDAHAIGHASGGSVKAQSTTEVANRAALFTTFVECHPGAR